MKQTRDRLGQSQSKAAAALGVPQSTLSRWETGCQMPSIASVGKISKWSNRSPREVIAGFLPVEED
jgi:transcriptional regulator with XRE-family HTH domain